MELVLIKSSPWLGVATKEIPFQTESQPEKKSNSPTQNFNRLKLPTQPQKLKKKRQQQLA